MKARLTISSGLWTALLAALAATWIAAGTGLTPGVAGEWQWHRYVSAGWGALLPAWGLGAVPPLAAALALAYWGPNRWWRRWGILVCGAWLGWNLAGAGPNGNAENAVAILDRHTGGYFTAAVNIRNPGDYFRDYVRTVALDADRDNHLDVHPPGNVLFSYGVLAWARVCPISLEAVIGDRDAATLRELVKTGCFSGIPDRTEVYAALAWHLVLFHAALWVASILLCDALGALGQGGAGRSPWGVLWIAFGSAAPVLFLGHYDTLMFALAAVPLWLLARTLTSARSWGWAAACGFSLGVITGFTLAFGLLTIWTGAILAWRKRTDARVLAAWCGGGMAALLVWYGFGIDLISCLWYNSRNNSAYFAQSGRSCVRWWPWNAFDLLMFAGPATMVLALWGQRFRRFATDSEMLRRGLAVLLVFLTVSPFSRGEVGRLAQAFGALPLLLAALTLTRGAVGWRLGGAMLLAATLSMFALRTNWSLLAIYGGH